MALTDTPFPKLRLPKLSLGAAPKIMSIQEAKEQGLQLIPKWAPVLAVILIPVGWIGQGAVNWVTQGYQLTQVRSEITSINNRIDAINTDREARHREYEASVTVAAAAQATLAATIKQYGAQLDRIEDRVDHMSGR